MGRSWRGWLCLVSALLATPLAAQDRDTADEPEGLPAIASTGEVIRAIQFHGNRVTRESILRQEMLVKEGDLVDAGRIERSRQAIMDLGLFTSVRAAVAPGDEGSVLHIYVKEKYYILPVPKLNRNDENDISLGAELTLDNLAGLNQQLKLRYESEDADTVSGGEITTNSIFYSYPRLFGGPWLLRSELFQQRSPAEVVTAGGVDSLYELKAWTATLHASRWLNPLGPSRGWQAGGGLVWRRNGYDYESGAVSDRFRDATAVGVTLTAQFIDVHDYLFSRRGVDYGYNGEVGLPGLGSDTRYTRHELYYRKYLLLEGRAHENIELQWRLGLSSGEIFAGDEYAYALGGNKTLRGYDSGSYQGNAFLQFNIQYLRPLFGYHPLRGVLFFDVGNAYPSNERIDLRELKWDAGLGLRLRLKAFVKIDLRVDAAYAYDVGEFKVFAGTKEMF
jgi:outer membrane protein assembly factor BamA